MVRKSLKKLFIIYLFVSRTININLIGRIKNLAYNHCLDEFGNGTDINTYGCTFSEQFFELLFKSSEIFQLKNTISNLCLNLSSASQVILTETTCSESDDQFWKIQFVNGLSGYKIKNVRYERCISIADNSNLTPAGVSDCTDMNLVNNTEDFEFQFTTPVEDIKVSPNAFKTLSKVSNGNCGIKIEKAGIKTAIYSKDIFYQITNGNNILKNTKGRWSFPFSEKAIDISINKDGTIYIITEDKKIKKFNGNNFIDTNQTGIRVASTPDGNAYAIDEDKKIKFYNGNIWSSVFDKKNVYEISVGANGRIWILNFSLVGYKNIYNIYRLSEDGNIWDKILGDGIKISVGPKGNAWLVNFKNVVFEFNGYGWDKRFEGVSDLSVGIDGAVTVIGTEVGRGGFVIHKYDNC